MSQKDDPEQVFTMTAEHFIPRKIMLASSLIQVNTAQIDGAQLHCLSDNMGFILPRSVIEEILEAVAPFYDSFSDDDITKFNSHKLNHPDRFRSHTSRPSKSKTGFVYLAKSGLHHKIGVSIEPRTRIKQIGSPYPVELIHTIATKDMETLEAELHDRFSEKRLNGEWFELDRADVEYIKGL